MAGHMCQKVSLTTLVRVYFARYRIGMSFHCKISGLWACTFVTVNEHHYLLSGLKRCGVYHEGVAGIITPAAGIKETLLRIMECVQGRLLLNKLTSTSPPMDQNMIQAPSAAVFCPQSKAPDATYLDQLRTYLCGNEKLKPFLQAIIGLSETWQIFANAREDIAALSQGPRYMQSLADWIQNGESSAVANAMSGIISLPLLTIIQIGQYFQYLEYTGMTHSGFLSQIRDAGAQGYCGGLLPAIAIACSRDETELVKNATISMRIALGMGAYGELGDDEANSGPTTIVVRLKLEGQGDEIVQKFPGVSFIIRQSKEKRTALRLHYRRIFLESRIQKPLVSSVQCRYLPRYKPMHPHKDCWFRQCIFEARCTIQRTPI